MDRVGQRPYRYRVDTTEELLLIVVSCGVAGFLIGRWRALLVPVVLWGGLLLFVVINDGWYGEGWGDFGVAFNILSALLTVLLTAAGVVLRVAIRGGWRRASQRSRRLPPQ